MQQRNGISLRLIRIDRMFERLQTAPIIVNDIVRKMSSAAAAEHLNRLLRTHYQNDSFGTVPQCECGATMYAANLGVVCKQCGTEVVRDITRPFESRVWIERPHGIDTFINPRFLALMNEKFGRGEIDIIRFLTDPKYKPDRPTERTNAIRDVIADAGIERNINYFYRHFDEVMNVVLTPTPFVKYGKVKRRRSKDTEENSEPEAHIICEQYREFIERYRDCIFCNRLPLPDRILFPSVQTGQMTYVDPTMSLAMDAVSRMCSLENSTRPLSAEAVISETMAINSLLMEYHYEYKTNNLGKKTGTFRRHMGGTRTPYSGRAVIAPITEEHQPDELHVPWKFIVPMMQVHIANKMLRLGYSPREITKAVDTAAANCNGAYSDVISEILEKLIGESPSRGIDVAMLRNPTLERLSNQPFRITKILRSNHAYAIKLSVMIIKGPNAD